MAYSRWSDSDWYTYWLAEDDDGGDPRLEMWHVDGEDVGARYSELVGIDEDGLAKLFPPRPSIAELYWYVRQFCAEVADERAAK